MTNHSRQRRCRFGMVGIAMLVTAMLGGTHALAAGFSIDGIPDGPAHVLSSTVDLQGNLWVATEDTGVYCHINQQWTNYTMDDGLPDNGAYAIACDHQGRIWIGHRNHGVSVFCNGKFRNYDWTNGPAGSHVFAIAVCPKDGDVWIATELGLTRFNPASGHWNYYNRATGLPTDQIDSIAFDPNGNLILGTQCDGIVIVLPDKDYSTFRQIPGPTAIPQTNAGNGLPSDNINQIFVARDQTIYAATSRGLARSHDHGVTWSYIRGVDWPALARGSYEGVAADWKPDGPGILLQNRVNCITEDSAGHLWLGFREKGWQAIDPVNNTSLNVETDPAYATSFSTRPDGSIITSTYTGGVFQMTPEAADANHQPAPAPQAQADFPPPASPPTPQQLAEMLATLKGLERANPFTAECLPDDWVTGGDWCGRYGRQYAGLSGAGYDTHNTGDVSHYQIQYLLGPYFPGRSCYVYNWGMKGMDPLTALWDPVEGRRIMINCNDGSFDEKTFPRTIEGPDLYVGVHVPEGVHRIAIYLISPDGLKGADVRRDYLLEVKAPLHPAKVPDGPVVQANLEQEDLIPVELSPALASSRAQWLHAGVYKQFLVNGGGTWWIKLVRNHSFVTQLQGVFVDRLGPTGSAFDRTPLNYQQNMTIDPPTVPDDDKAMEARALWDAINDSSSCKNAGAYRGFAQLLAYRVALAANADPVLLANWRWHMNAWNEDDRKVFDDFAKRDAHAMGATEKPDDN